MTEPNLPFSHPTYSIDLKTCEEEPIRTPGAIQSHGALLGFDVGGVVRVVSENFARDFFGKPAAEVVGSARFADVLPTLDLSTDLVARNPIAVTVRDQPYDAIFHTANGLTMCELEPAIEAFDDLTYQRTLRDLVTQLHRAASLDEMRRLGASIVRQVTGFDRVMIYRFDSDWNGEVVAEAKREDLEPFLGQHYPASDIPVQARLLYERNWVRIIADVNYQPAHLYPLNLPSTNAPLDLGHAVLRSVSPVHIKYLQNMGVGASMSISLLRNDKLWGLIACHHYSPRRLRYAVRQSCETLGQILSWQAAAREESEERQITAQAAQRLNQLIERFSENDQLVNALKESEQELLALTDSSGLYVSLGEDSVGLGTVPRPELIDGIKRLMQTNARHAPWATAELRKSIKLHEPDLAVAAGVIAVPLALAENYFVIWFRPEHVRTIEWAGNPEDTVKSADQFDRLSPRGSFALWRQTVSGQSRPFTPLQVASASRFGSLFFKNIVQKNRLLQERNRELDNINRAKDDFLATVSHELRTPLNAILGWIELMERGVVKGEKFSDGLNIIKRNATAQAQLIADLLDISRIIAGKLSLSVEVIPLSEIIEEVFQSFMPAAEARGIVFRKIIDSTDSVNGDRARIQQVIWNLVGNAIKFTPKGGKVSILVRREASTLVVDIKDSGRGIEEKHLKVIFGRFAQLDSSFKRSAGGLGLGLSIVRHLVELHGGEVSATSPGVDKGSTFTVRLPVSALAGRAAKVEEAPAIPDKPLRNFRLLVVEDDADSAKFLTLLLQSQGAEVAYEPDGQAALNRLERDHEFQAVLSDIGMPHMDGLELARRLRSHQNPKLRLICLIALTAYARGVDRTVALRTGFNSYVSKPVDPDELLAVIENACGVAPRR